VIRLVVASANAGKVAEIADVLGDAVELVPRPEGVPVPVEDAGDLVGNARIKAAALCDATGLPAVADDTGLEVDALGGAPGVDTAHYGDGTPHEHGWQRLLAELGDRHDRTARFRTVALVRWPDGRELVAEGVCEGTIATAARGGGGFGYDPVFVPSEGDGRVFAEMSRDEKNAVSHRGRAFRALAARLTGD
jgi:XTP/dITP diphosphohydrolase